MLFTNLINTTGVFSTVIYYFPHKMSASELTSDAASAELGKWLSASVRKNSAFQVDAALQDAGAGYIEEFSSWISEKVAFKSKNGKLQPVIYILTNFAILETAQHVFSIGSGFVSPDMTRFTVAQILETVQRIEAKVDTMLKEPLNTAIDFFNAAMKEIKNKKMKHAYISLDKVIDNATKAFHFVSGKKVSIGCFEESIKAIQLLIFARISRYSYDEEQNSFLPYPTLPAESITMIGDSLEDLVEKSLKQRKNVKKSFLSKSKDKSKIQDILDQVLKICYSYISQAKGWTNMRTKINPNDNKFTIPVMPQYLPEGYEDAVKVIVGVKTGDDQPSSVLLWRSVNYVYSMFGNVVKMEKITSETDLLNIDIMDDNCSVVIYSHGGAARYQGSILGQYYLWDVDKNIYKQFNTENGHKPNANYIYYYSSGVGSRGWSVSDVPGGVARRRLFNFNDTISRDNVPETGWRYYDNDWTSDDTLVVTRGPMTLSGDIIITADITDKCPQYTGVFHVTDRMCYGKPVFVNDHGKILYSGGHLDDAYRWHIADIIDEGNAIRSTGAPNCPGDIRATLPWQYLDGSEWRDCNASVVNSNK